MNTIFAKPMLGVFGLGGMELLMLAVVAMFMFTVVAVVVGLIVYFTRPIISKKDSPPPASPRITPPPPPAPSPAPSMVPRTEVTPRQCPQCGAVLKPDAPEGLCPACLLQRGIATESGAPADKPPFVPPPVSELAALFPQLEILECLGRGGMGAVYKARQPRLERFVALKILSPEKQNDAQFAERFGREARALARLNHPNIVTVYDFGEVQGRFYLLMEFVDGLTLRQVLQAGKLAPPEALKIVPKICEALQYAHEQGIIHRDIKPENILLDRQGRVKIADFGIAKIAGLESQDRSLTGAKDVMGTPHYMAPEQVEQPQAVDHRADIYSLGVVFYEMLTGELPLGKFMPPSAKAAMDLRLDQVVMHALEKEPAQRYQQASQVKTDVETIAGGPSPGLPPGTPSGLPPIAPAPIPPLAPGHSGSGKIILPAFLLAFFFGVFGAHRFYVGRIWTGLLQLGGLFGCVLLIIICATIHGGPAQDVFGIMLGALIVSCGVWATIDWILLVCKVFTDGEGRRITNWTTPGNGQPGPPPQTPSAASGAGKPAAAIVPAAGDNRMLVTAPAVALMVAAGWNLFRGFVALVLFSGGDHVTDGFMGGLGIFGGFAPLLITNIIFFNIIPAVFVFCGGYQMLHRRSYAWALAAGIISIVACSLLGFPAGVWALIVLAREDVRSIFRSAAANPASSARPGIHPALVVLFALLILFSGLFLGAYALWHRMPRIFPGNTRLPEIRGGLPQFSPPRFNPANPQLSDIRQDLGEYRRDFNQTFPLTDNGHFDLDNVNGRIEIHGWDNNSVAVQANIHDRDIDSVNGVNIDVTSQPDRIRIHTDQPDTQSSGSVWPWLAGIDGHNDKATVDYVIQVPRRARLDYVSSVNGGITIDGVTGDISTTTVNGPTNIKDAAGSLKTSTVNGGINVKMTALSDGQHVSFDTVNGGVNLVLPENADANFSLSTVNGDISSEFPALQPKKIFPVGTELKGSLGSGTAEVRGTTVNGAFHIAKRENTAGN